MSGEVGNLLAQAGGGADVLIYVHGFNQTFEKAALNAARLSDAIKFLGLTMLFSWPFQRRGCSTKPMTAKARCSPATTSNACSLPLCRPRPPAASTSSRTAWERC